jgi:hypothetical protein
VLRGMLAIAMAMLATITPFARSIVASYAYPAAVCGMICQWTA